MFRRPFVSAVKDLQSLSLALRVDIGIPDIGSQDLLGPSKASEELFNSAAKSSARLGLGYSGLRRAQPFSVV